MILLTGFGPFGKNFTNLSSELVTEFPFEYRGFQIKKGIIPVSWKHCIKTYKMFLSPIISKPDLVILLGIHKKSKIYLEKFGWNFKIGNDIENKFKFGPIKLDYLPFLRTILNLNKIYSNLKDKAIISISNFPGFYLCNYLYYWALYLSKKEYPLIFIHIPDKGDIYEYIKKLEMILKTIIKIHFDEIS